MPPPSPASGGKLRRTLLAAVIVIAVSAYGFVELGVFLAKDDPLRKVDAIVVLSGSTMRRPLEAVDLYVAGYKSDHRPYASTGALVAPAC